MPYSPVHHGVCLQLESRKVSIQLSLPMIGSTTDAEWMAPLLCCSALLQLCSLEQIAASPAKNSTFFFKPFPSSLLHSMWHKITSATHMEIHPASW
jgi:hypothetical protein